MKRGEYVRFYIMTKGTTVVILTQYQVPRDARDLVLLAYAKAGYEVREETKQVE